jgi:hypothetical protein
MFSTKMAFALIALALSFAFVFSASAQWTPGGMAINFGGFDLGSAPTESSGIKPYMIGNHPLPLQTAQADIVLPSNSTTTANSTDINSSISQQPIQLPAEQPQPSALPVVDLSGYGKNRREGNLEGYTNIMYPIAESAGFTATAAGGSGSGGGCCGG